MKEFYIVNSLEQDQDCYLNLQLHELYVMDGFFKHRAYIDLCPVWN